MRERVPGQRVQRVGPSAWQQEQINMQKWTPTGRSSTKKIARVPCERPFPTLPTQVSHKRKPISSPVGFCLLDQHDHHWLADKYGYETGWDEFHWNHSSTRSGCFTSYIFIRVFYSIHWLCLIHSFRGRRFLLQFVFPYCTRPQLLQTRPHPRWHPLVWVLLFAPAAESAMT